jgi:uncharacterized protein YidB (DUF937 family)
MGLLDDLLGGLAGQAAPQSQARPPQPGSAAGAGGMSQVMMALLPVVLAMLAQRRAGSSQARQGAEPGGSGGGLADLIAGFERAGFGAQAQSWVGRGANQALPSDAIEQVFGRGGLAEIARRAGVSEADASRGLSQLLPEVVDRVTPEGQVPQADALVASVEALRRRLGAG